MNRTQENSHDLRDFQGSSIEFLVQLIKLQTKVSGSDTGFILKIVNGETQVLVSLTDMEDKASWVQAVSSQIPQLLRQMKPQFYLYGKDEKVGFLLLPFPQKNRPCISVLVTAPDFNPKSVNWDFLNATFVYLDNFEARMTLNQRRSSIKKIHNAVDLSLVCNRKDSFASFCHELCNEVSNRWQCSRVSLGFVKQGHVKVEFISQVEKFSRKMKLIRDLEASMEECVDQDKEILCPPVESSRYIYRQMEIFSLEYEKANLLCLPLHYKNEVCGALLIEKKHNQPFDVDELETLQLLAELVTVRIVELKEKETFFYKSLNICSHPLQYILGKDNLAMKLGFMFMSMVLIFLATAKGSYHVEGSMQLEVQDKKTISSPFDGILQKVNVKPGESIVEGQLLGQMDVVELQLRILELSSEQLNLKQEFAIAFKEKKTAKTQIIETESDALDAKMKLLKYKLARAQIVSPISGTLISEDLTNAYRPPVQKGDVLFVVSNTKKMKGLVFVPEDQIASLQLGMKGEIIVAGRPGEKIPVSVSEIAPLAKVIENMNVFRVIVTLESQPAWLKPGMEGLFKVAVEERLLVWIWCRKAIAWVRMTLWL